MKISAVVAASENNAIGLKGNLLWRLPLDMEFFKNVTRGHHVLMGRKSWESLPKKFRPLDGRVNLVITRQPGYRADGAIVLKNIEEGIEYAKKEREKELMIIGGGEIYRQSLPQTDRVYLTRVHHIFAEADTFFPVLPANEWKMVKDEPHPADEKHKYSFDFLVYERR